MGQQLAGKIAIVTGGASGIGKATVKALTDEGATVVILDRDRKGAEEVVTERTQAGKSVKYFPIDLSDVARVEPVFELVASQLGQVDILVNCAGIYSDFDLLHTELEHWEFIMAVNLTAPAFLTKAMAKHLIKRGVGGKIVNVSSGCGFRAGTPLVYSCSKAGLAMLTKVVAKTLGKYDVNVNTVAPGATDTPMITPDRRESVEQQIASGGELGNMLGRMSTPEDVANGILFLCLPAARQVTAHTLHLGAGTIYWS